MNSLTKQILGLLDERPAHGYALKKCLASFVGPGGEEPNDGFIYPALGRLTDEGLASKSAARAKRSGRARFVYRLTGKGRKAFLNWLESGEDELDAVRFSFFSNWGFLSKCNFFSRMPPELRRRKILLQKRMVREKIRDFKAVRSEMESRGANAVRLHILDYGLMELNARSRWLNALEALTEREETT